MRNLRWRQAPGKSWLSFEEIRTRLEVGPGTPSLKRPAKTFAPGHIKYSQGITQGYAGGSRRNGTPPNLWSETRSEVRRGVTVVGELAERETERILTGASNAARGEHGWVQQACARTETGQAPSLRECVRKMFGRDAACRVWEWRECLLLISWGNLAARDPGKRRQGRLCTRVP